MSKKTFMLQLTIPKKWFEKINQLLEEYAIWIIGTILSTIAIIAYLTFYQNGLGLAYNDARSHLDIGRRVVEGLKPGLAQLGSVWLPLPHLLMMPTVWNDIMWHSGFSGALQSMISFVATGILIYLFLKKLGVGLLGSIIGVLVFILNINILYLQSTAMTELLLLATMTAGAYYLLLWFKEENILSLITAAFWIMLSSLVRYDGWFLFGFASLLIVLAILRKRGYQMAEGILTLFATLAGLGIALWFLWNLLIFRDPLYFVFGPFSAHRQQSQLQEAGVLATKGNFPFSLQVYLYALIYNSGAFITILGLFGAVLVWLDKKLSTNVKIACIVLIAPFIFNILALYLGHSVLFISGLSGNTWFNVRYGIMLMPSLAIFIGFMVDRLKDTRLAVIGLFIFVSFLSFTSTDAVTIDDALVGSSQKNVTEVSGWLKENTSEKDGFILISAASHDAIIFSSGLPMKRFIHEGTGSYWENAATMPDRWARWIVMRTHDDDDLTFKSVKNSPGFKKFELVDHYPFADIYQLKPEYLGKLNTEPILGKLK